MKQTLAKKGVKEERNAANEMEAKTYKDQQECSDFNAKKK